MARNRYTSGQGRRSGFTQRQLSVAQNRLIRAGNYYNGRNATVRNARVINEARRMRSSGGFGG